MKSPWLKAARPHTLPLAVCGIIIGNALAVHDGFPVNYLLFLLTFITALLLQILSNFANDYGDTVNGADNEKRNGPERMVQSGNITSSQIKKVIILFALLALVCGSLSLMVAVMDDRITTTAALILYGAGLLAIGAAYAYTATKNPYGYMGLGDVSVFLFFGVLSVAGSYYLQSGYFSTWILLPATGLGLLCAGVLNVNNVRDIESDKAANKRTIPVRLGRRNSIWYHWLLMSGAVLLFAAFAYENFMSHAVFVFMFPAFLFLRNAQKLSAAELEKENPLLKHLVISILIFSLTFSAALALLS